MGHKRKRQHDAADDARDALATPTKVQVTEDNNANTHLEIEQLEKKSKSSRKQIRSERRAKKSQQAKANAAQNLKAQREKHDTSATVDRIAQGSDFIPLNEDDAGALTVEHSANKNRLNSKPKKAKNIQVAAKGATKYKASPRSIRLAAKQEKARAAVEKEYGADAPDERDGGMQQQSLSEKAPRFICFVGNLPYDCTTEQLHVHFSKLSPKSIRHSTDKATGKSKGYAFLEFADYDKMKTCLKLYHHSIFEPDRLEQKQKAAGAEAKDILPRIADKKNKGRMINVELTVGGGGKGGARKKKIKDKNVKLEEQRSRRRELEKKKAVPKGKNAKNDSLANGKPKKDPSSADDGRGDIHPSRMKRVVG